jgi:hypothetical protein
MLIQIFSLSPSPWTTERKVKEKKIFLFSLIHFFSSSSQSRTFRNCSDIHSLNIRFISDWARRQETKTSTLNIYYGNKTFKSILNDYFLSFSNRYLFDYGQWSIRFSICLVQWYVYVRINTFLFVLFFSLSILS